MAGRPKHYKDEELIDRAIEAFWLKGYTATSAKDLLKVMDIGQGSFYLSFKGGKKELYKKSLIRFSKKNLKQFDDEIHHSADPIKYIKDFFLSITDRTIQQKYNGCYLGNSIVELSNLDEDTKLLSVELLSKLKNSFEKGLATAIEKGTLDRKKSPSLIAMYLINLWNGVNVSFRMYPENKEIKEMISLSLQILD